MENGARAGLNRSRHSTQTGPKLEYQNGQYGMQGTMGTTASGSGTSNHLVGHPNYLPSNTAQPQRALNSTQSWAHAQSQMVIKQEPASSASATSQKPPAQPTAANGARSEPPKRAIEIEQLAVGHPDIAELVRTNGSSSLLLQGDAQVITKQRVETAIRVILDLVRQIPTSSTHSLHPSVQHLLQPSLGLPATLERVGTFRSIKLQKGTTTKASPKKLLAQGEAPKEETLWLETAVYMSGGEKRVYACKRCRARETKRRLAKDAARKKQSTSESETPSSREPNNRLNSSHEPSADYITGENPHQYDPLRASQLVEQPNWDPELPDWRHEIVLFNSPPELPLKDGSCNWLPFRVVCYGKCHGEKTGFRIKFILRTFDGHVVASAMTPPIRITDDHKTDAKARPRATDAAGKPVVAASRARKGRQSQASSARHSPTDDDDASQVNAPASSVGAARQVNHARAGKPYERPPSQTPQSPASSLRNGNFHLDGYSTSGTNGTGYDSPKRHRFQRQQSASSIHSLASLESVSRGSSVDRFAAEDDYRRVKMQHQGTVSPGALRRQFPGLTSLDPSQGQPQYSFGINGLPNGNTGLISPRDDSQQMARTADDMLYLNLQNTVSNPSGSALGFSSMGDINMDQGPAHGLTLAQPQHPMFSPRNGQQLDLSDNLVSGFDSLFAGSVSSHSQSLDDSSVLSGYGDSSSSHHLYGSNAELSPNTGLDEFMDFSGNSGMTPDLPNSPFQTRASPLGGQPVTASSLAAINSGMPDLFHMDNGHIFAGPRVDMGMPFMPNTSTSPQQPPQADPTEQLFRDLMASSAAQAAPPASAVTHVIPGEGNMCGGVQIAIAGRGFMPGVVVVFGNRPAVTKVVSDSFLECVLPPSAYPGEVEVSLQGFPRGMGEPPKMFRYTNMDKEMMRLALEVREQYQGSSSDAAYRLAERVAKSTTNSEWSERSSSSPPNNQPSPADAGEVAEMTQDSSSSSHPSTSSRHESLQATLLTFIASLDEDSPGALRRSGAVRHCNGAKQSLLHLSATMGFHRLIRRLVVVGADLDAQDANGFTPLSFAVLSGQTACARLLMEAGAAYDKPTVFGELPLDLAKQNDQPELESLLLAAVWATTARVDEPIDNSDAVSEVSNDHDSEIDDDNPSSDSESEDDTSRSIVRTRSRRSTGKRRASDLAPALPHPPMVRTVSPANDVQAVENAVEAVDDDVHHDEPPPYAPPDSSSWMRRTLANIPHPHVVPDAVWDRLPLSSTIFGSEKQAAVAPHGWVAFPAPSWEMLQKMTSPEEVKMFTQAMAAAALSAVVQSGATIGGAGSPSRMEEEQSSTLGTPVKKGRTKRRTKSMDSRDESSSSTMQVQPAKHDRMLYLFWLPILLFMGFWLAVTALPIATGFGIIYFRQISRAIKNRM